MNYLYLFRGKVVRGRKRGRTLGFPTVNVRLYKNIPEGVYVSETGIDGTYYRSVSFVGAAKTFGEKKVFGESFIFDFDRDLYDKWISVRLLEKLRGNIKFATAEELIRQMEKDITAAKKFFENR